MFDYVTFSPYQLPAIACNKLAVSFSLAVSLALLLEDFFTAPVVSEYGFDCQ